MLRPRRGPKSNLGLCLSLNGSVTPFLYIPNWGASAGLGAARRSVLKDTAPHNIQYLKLTRARVSD